MSLRSRLIYPIQILLLRLDLTSLSQIFELHNEQTRDLFSKSRNSLPKISMGLAESFIELVQEEVDNPGNFFRVLKVAFQSRGVDVLKFKRLSSDYHHTYML